MSTAQALRDACAKVRLKSFPLSDLIPLMQQAADELEGPATTLLESHLRYTASHLPRDPVDEFIPQAAPTLIVAGESGMRYAGPPAFTETVALPCGTKLYAAQPKGAQA